MSTTRLFGVVALALATGLALTGCSRRRQPETEDVARQQPPSETVVDQPDPGAGLRADEEIERERALATIGEPIYFDFDRSDLRPEAREVLNQKAEMLRRYPDIRVRIEGHCDERGTVEYNLALGERRARTAYDYLASLGVPGDRMKTVSYGKEIPVCGESTEECWARNRRDHFAVTGKVSP
jgi:peptidoglycan-associated lipoprotein